MYLWDWRTGYNFQRLSTTAQPGSLDSEAGIFMCCFDMSGCRLLTAEADKTIKIYREDEAAVCYSQPLVTDCISCCCIPVHMQTEETHPINWKPEILRRKRY